MSITAITKNKEYSYNKSSLSEVKALLHNKVKENEPIQVIITDKNNFFIKKYLFTMIYSIQGLYDGHWEDVTWESVKKEAVRALKDYDVNEPEYWHRIRKSYEFIEE